MLCAPGCTKIRYCVTGDPPSSVGAVITTVAFVSPRAAVIVGAAGAPIGVTEFDVLDA